jgi:hypothetical protein
MFVRINQNSTHTHTHTHNEKRNETECLAVALAEHAAAVQTARGGTERRDDAVHGVRRAEIRYRTAAHGRLLSIIGEYGQCRKLVVVVVVVVVCEHEPTRNRRCDVKHRVKRQHDPVITLR